MSNPPLCTATMYQYRITIGDRQYFRESYPENWGDIMWQHTERGTPVKLGRRLVTQGNPLFLDCLRNVDGDLPTGSMVLRGTFVSAWETIADNSDRPWSLIGGMDHE